MIKKIKVEKWELPKISLNVNDVGVFFASSLVTFFENKFLIDFQQLLNSSCLP